MKKQTNKKLTSDELLHILQSKKDYGGHAQLALMQATSLFGEIDFHKIPPLSFKPEWDVRIVPPIGGASMRFWVEYKGRIVSVYCDLFSFLGYYGGSVCEPYWEMYPRTYSRDYEYKDTMRFGLYDTKELIEEIDKELNGIPVKE